MQRKSLCGKCSDGWRYCQDCRNLYARRNRKPHHALSDEQRRRANARSYANVYLRRGKIERLPCEICGSPDSEMVHEDYSKPLEVRWLCKKDRGRARIEFARECDLALAGVGEDYGES